MHVRSICGGVQDGGQGSTKVQTSFQDRSELFPERRQPRICSVVERAGSSAAHHGALALGPEDALLDGFRPRLLQRALLLSSHLWLLCCALSAQARPSERQSQCLHELSHIFTDLDPSPQRSSPSAAAASRATLAHLRVLTPSSFKVSHEGPRC